MYAQADSVKNRCGRSMRKSDTASNASACQKWYWFAVWKTEKNFSPSDAFRTCEPNAPKKTAKKPAMPAVRTKRMQHEKAEMRGVNE